MSALKTHEYIWKLDFLIIIFLILEQKHKSDLSNFTDVFE